ncbi:MAG TPA: MazG nucleotide pyrophosphohydrolase domain-containing protein [Acidimicrobiales bacterium]|nr:MazG nucleotide pyrophosphohydrolase domain-containing protein [Acidimicrobiales bacterium]
MGTLRSECPWDRVQTHASLRRHLLEEAYEALDVLDRLARCEADGAAAPVSDAFSDLSEELGDVLFQVVFHSHLAAEEGRFDLAAVIDGVREKLVGRHPAIFGVDGAGSSPDEIERLVDGLEARGAEWERAKVAEKGRDSVMDGIPATLPALLYASKVVGKASVVAPELLAARASGGGTAGGDATRDEAALGRDLLATVLATRDAGLDAEAALRSAARELELAVRAAEGSVPATDGDSGPV